MSAPKDSTPPSFEFTKRKRWADLLVTELADSIIFVLSTDCKILYCGTAVTELLGWRDSELLNRSLRELIISEDWDNFRIPFEQGNEFVAYTRLRTKDGTQSSSHALFEIKARPSMACLFVMARPYPSRNTATLNTFLGLKVENERLQRRLRELSGQAPESTTAESSTTSRYTNNPGPLPLYTSTSLMVGGSEDAMASVAKPAFDTNPQSSLYATNTLSDHHEEEEGSKKKKLKKSHGSEQYVCVTCGRTDSPEWRKGPLGPKTLCNACGLRWAKLQRKTDDVLPQADAGEGGGEQLTLS